MGFDGPRHGRRRFSRSDYDCAAFWELGQEFGDALVGQGGRDSRIEERAQKSLGFERLTGHSAGRLARCGFKDLRQAEPSAGFAV